VSLFGLFDIGKSAIFASQTALNVISNNIANVNTPGYSRQEVILEVANPVEMAGEFIGRGVVSADIKRHYDRFINLQIIEQNKSYGRSYTLYQALSYVEQIFNEAQNIGLADSLKDYFSAWQEVSANAEGGAQRIALLQNAGALVHTAQQMENDILDTLENVNKDIENVIVQVNMITSNISTINEKIAQIEAGLNTEQAGFFRDERERMLNELAGLIDYTSYEDKDGYVTVLVGGKSVVTQQRSFDFTTSADLNGDTNVFLRGQNMNATFQSGQLGGLLAVRDDIKDNPLYGLRKLVASIVKETNIVHRTGYGLDSSTNNDFFNALQVYTQENSAAGYISSSSVSNPSALTLDEYNINFINGGADYEVYNVQTGALVTSGVGFVPGSTISFDGIDVDIDGVLANGDSFFISPLRGVIQDFGVAISDTDKISAASLDTDLPGDNTKALEIIQLSQTDISDLNDSTFENYYSSIVSAVGVMSRAAADSLNYDDNLLFELERKREAVSGVSLDEEAANMIRFQRSFEAGARILQVTDELLETIINL
jgi:flagellar hook-associated protein 1 FlgK